MSSSVVAESSDSNKSENTVIILVNNDGSISVDEQTLQKLLVANQQNATVSVVRVGGSQGDEGSQDNTSESNTTDMAMSEGQPQVNLTVEGYYPPSTPASTDTQCTTMPAVPADPVVVGTDSLVDPFLEMDPEQLERLETALQSEQAKQILGEGVTAMLDMLTSEDDQTTLKDSIRMDHCYTSCMQTLVEPGSVAGPSGTARTELPQSSQSSQDENDEDVTESEEEPDSEEDAKYRRGARTRGRGRAQTRGGRGLTNVRGKARVRGGMKKGGATLPAASTMRTLPARIPASPVTTPIRTLAAKVAATPTPIPVAIAPAKSTAGLSILTPVRTMPARTNQNIAASPVVTQAMTPVRVTPARGTAAVRNTLQVTPQTAVKVESDDVDVSALVIDEQKPTGRAKARTVSQSEAPSKNKRKPNILAAKRTPARRATTETPTPKVEEKLAPVPTPTPTTPRRASISVEDKGDLSPDAARKMYPKRENRKPPAHLAEAFGPALFSTPDIPRRISDAAKTPEGKSETDLVAEMAQVLAQDQAALEAQVKLELAVIAPPNQTLEPLEPDSKEMLVAELQAVLLGELGDELEKHADSKQENELVYPVVSQNENIPEDNMEPMVIDESKVEMKPVVVTKPTKTVNKTNKRRSSTNSKVSTSEVKEMLEEEGSRKRRSGVSKVTAQAIKELQAPSDEEEEKEKDEDEESWNSEDDPDRLWCICQKPHNNRFMICCDRCEDWFHGHCVGVTKAMGQQMEEKGQEWTCPPCSKLRQQELQVERAKAAESKRAQAQQGKVQRRNSTAKSVEVAAKPADTSKRRKSDDKVNPAKPSVAVHNVMCIVCKKVAARSASVYCSDECILKHAQESLSMLNRDKTAKSTPTAPTKVEEKVVTASGNTVELVVFERKSGQLLTGSDAPTPANLKQWLQKNPSFEVMKPAVLNKFRDEKTGKIIIAKQGVKQPTVLIKQQGVKPPAQQQKSTLLVPAQRIPVPIKPAPIKPAPAGKSVAGTLVKAAANTPAGAVVKPPTSPTKAKPAVATPVKAPAKPVQIPAAKPATTPSPNPATSEKSRKQSFEGGEPIRINVRRTLKETLHSRIQECDDLKVSENEVKGIATTIEEELFSLFKDTGAKYKAKYRSLNFNIRDPKNLALFRKIVTSEVTPHQLVRLSPEELATKELAQWREREAKHTLEMIKKNEMELMSQAIQYVMKTHKGEQVIETDDSLKLQASAVEAEITEPVLEAASSTVEDTALNSSLSHTIDKTSDKKSSSSSKHSSHHKHHHRDSDRRSGSSSSRYRDDKKYSRRSSSSRSKHHKDSKDRDSRSKSSKDNSKESSKDSKHHSKSHHSSESSKTRHHSSESAKTHHHSSETPEGDKSSRSSSSQSKTSEHKVKEKSSKAPTSTSSTPPPPPITKPEPEVMIEPELMPLEEELIQESVVPVVEDADLSDREPSSTVTIKTPDSNVDEPSLPSVWRGFINMMDVAKFFITAQEVSGCANGLEQELADTLDIVGRISPETVWDYISKMKKTGTKEIVVVRMRPANPEEKNAYTSLYTYLSSRNRFGVVGNKCPIIKDFYIMPLSSHSPVPQVLLPLNGPGFEESRPHLLLGIIIRSRRKRPADVAGMTEQPVKSNKEARLTDRSYTPPLPDPPRGSGSYTPPLPTRTSLLDDKEDDAPYSPGGSSDSLVMSPPPPDVPVEFSSKLEELNRKIEEQKMQIESISSELVCTNSQSASSEALQMTTLLQQQISSQVLLTDVSQLVSQNKLTEQTTEYADSPDDENEAYSPSRSFTPPPPPAETGTFNLSDTSSISLPSNLQEILASIQRKGNTEVQSGLALETDPIVREYASAEPPESTTPPPPGTEEYIPEIVAIVPSRDPRRTQEPVQKSLSKLTEEELIAKANEMLEAVQPEFPPLPPLPPPIAAIPPPPLPPIIEAPLCSPTGGMGEWHAAATDESPRKGISFKVGKRPPQSRWSRSNSSGSQPDKKRSPSLSPPRSKRRHDSNSD